MSRGAKYFHTLKIINWQVCSGHLVKYETCFEFLLKNYESFGMVLGFQINMSQDFISWFSCFFIIHYFFFIAYEQYQTSVLSAVALCKYWQIVSFRRQRQMILSEGTYYPDVEKRHSISFLKKKWSYTNSKKYINEAVKERRRNVHGTILFRD